MGAISNALIAKKAQTKQDHKGHQGSRADAKEIMVQDIALRERKAAAYATFEADREKNLF